jgi:hypothetical protein
MEPKMTDTDTIQCKHCGVVNDVGNAICANCKRPLTAYGGQVGQEENFERRLSAQVEALEERPPVVTAITVFHLLFALAVPLWTVIAAWSAQPHVNAEGTNTVQSAAGTFVSILQTITLLPVAIAFCLLAYFTWTQRTWAWTANAIMLGLLVLLALILHGFALTTFIWAGLAGGFAYFWFQKPIKAWFGLD